MSKLHVKCIIVHKLKNHLVCPPVGAYHHLLPLVENCLPRHGFLSIVQRDGSLDRGYLL